jgi:predicted DNA-binding transcriptional regulator AlpA
MAIKKKAINPSIREKAIAMKREDPSLIAAEIASAVGVSRASVTVWLRSAGIAGKVGHRSGRPGSHKYIAKQALTPEVVAEIKCKGISANAVAKHLGLAHQAVLEFIPSSRTFIPASYTPDCYNSDPRLDIEIAASLGVTCSAIYHWKKRNNIPCRSYPKDLPMSPKAWAIVESWLPKVEKLSKRGADEAYLLEILQRSAAISVFRDDSNEDSHKYLVGCLYQAAKRRYVSTQDRLDWMS